MAARALTDLSEATHGLVPIELAPRSLGEYRPFLGASRIDEIERQAASLRGLRVAHVNATPVGGGVAEILKSLVPLQRDLGLDAHWYVLPPDDAFFSVTKKMHNLLQGGHGRLSVAERDVYLGYLEKVASRMRAMRADVWIVHDPQPLPLRSLVPLGGRTIWRCHIDSSTPERSLASELLADICAYDRSVFSLADYIFPGLPARHAAIVHPAIDPLTAKNRPLPRARARRVLGSLGLDPARPLVAQVSRFDPWKNPWQAVDAYRLAKRHIPELQLALVGVFAARDDPEGPKVYRSVRRHAGPDPDIHLYTDPDRVGATEVNAFQSASDVVLQRSSREGFGLTVTEAMWKARPVVATPVGGITVQVKDGQNGYLAGSAEECAQRIVELVTQPRLARRIGRAARDAVRERFLLPRLLRQHLALYDGTQVLELEEAA